MEGFKEFQGKDLDSAIAEACGFFNAAREKLEIEIVQDAKSGIFGIVGARKAKVRARRVQLREAVESILGKKSCKMAAPKPEPPAEAVAEHMPGVCESAATVACVPGIAPQRSTGGSSIEGGSGPVTAPRPRDLRQSKTGQEERGKSRGRKTQGREGFENNAPAVQTGVPEQRSKVSAGNYETRTEQHAGQAAVTGEKGSELSADGAESTRDTGRNGEGSGRSGQNTVPQGFLRDLRSRKPVHPGRPAHIEAASDSSDDDFEEVGEGLPVRPLEQLDAARLESLVEETVRQLVRPIAGEEVRLAVHVGGSRVHVSIECGEDSGLLIGREGQTLASLQYMISRIVSRGMNSAVRVQLDAGEYRRRQDEKLREMALALADKVRQSGRSYSTRPLSSYHRRIVHVCLQDAPDMQTRSSGEGPMKRVVIMRRKSERI